MTIPVIGFDKGAGVRIDLDALIVSRMLVQANSGAGKSHAIRYIAESTVGRVQQIIIDREGEFATLREKFPYALIGREGDAGANIKYAKPLARTLMELRLSTVIDISEMSLTQQREYVAEFVNAINHLPRPLWHDCLIFIDEAHLFAPEAGKGSSAASEAIALLLSTGRKRGYCAVLATQRLSKLSKDVAAECLNKLIGRTSNEDLRRAADELGQGKEASRDLRSLEKGQFWAYGPAIAPDPILVVTGDVATEPPERGEARAPAPPPPHKIKAALAQLAELPKQADEEARTLVSVQRENSELKRRVTQLEKGAPVVDQSAIAREVQRAVQATTRANAQSINALRKALEAAMKFIINVSTQNFDVAGVDKEELERAIGAAVMKATDMVDRRLATRQQQIDSLRLAASRIAAQLKAALGDEETVINVEVAKNEPFTVSAPPHSEPKRARVAPVASGDPVALPSGERAVLIAVAQCPDGAGREQVSILTGFKTSTRNTYIQRLQLKGFVEVNGASIFATDTGIGALGDFEPLPTGEGLRNYWLARLPEGEARVLGALVESYPEPLSRDAVSEVTGYKTSTRNTYIQRLGTRKLVTTSSDGVKASAILFEEE